ncbi:hypothetical protein [Actinoallomurus vinaceus]
MEKRKPLCSLPWCDSDHLDDAPTIARHRKTLGERTFGDALTVTVVARWAEHRDGRTGVLPHITINTTGLPEANGLDFTPRDAAELSELLSALWPGEGVQWLAAMLAAGAVTLAPHEDREHDGEPHVVTEDAPQRTGKDRFTWGLITDVFDTLHKHGYRQGDDQHTGRAIGMLFDLVDVYEGGDL